MSYILDALKKAERDRRMRRVPSLGTIHTPAEPSRRRLWPWVGGGAVAVNVVALALLFGVTREDGAPADTSPRASEPVAPAVAAATASTPGPPAGAAAPGTVAGNPVPGSPAGTGGIPLGGTPAASRTASAPSQAAPGRPVAAAAPESPAAERPTRPADPEAGRERGAPKRARSIAERPGSAMDPRPLDARSTPARATAATGDEALHARASGSRGSDLKLEVLVYADDPAERSAGINGRRYVEGQRVQGKLVIEKITPDAVVLGGEGPRVVLRQ